MDTSLNDDPLLKFDLRDMYCENDTPQAFLFTLRRLYLSHDTVRRAVNAAVLITERLAEARMKQVDRYQFGIRYTTEQGACVDLPQGTFDIHRVHATNMMVFVVKTNPENLKRLGNQKVWWMQKHVPHFAEGLKGGSTAHVLDMNRVKPLGTKS